MRVLITRPEPDAAKTAAKVSALGHETVIEPLLFFQRLTEARLPAGTFDAVVVTSANALRAAKMCEGFSRLLSLPLFAVGARTAEAARAAGFANARSADSDAVALGALLAHSLKPGVRVLHLAGEERAQELSALLAPDGIEVVVAVLYRMRAAERFGKAAAWLARGEIDAVLHYSPRSASTFVALAEREGLLDTARRVRHLCISPAAAAPLTAAGIGAKSATVPDEAAMLALLDL